MALSSVVSALRRRYGKPVPPPARGPFELILWELVGELLADDKRAAVFSVLRQRVGTTPAAIDDVDDKTLMEVASLGGMAAEIRAHRMREAARLAIADYGGALDEVLSRPAAEARRALRRFPAVGEPGADKILLLTRTHPVLALDSNALRVLLRLGYGTEESSYARTYGGVLRAVAPELREKSIAWLIDASLLLRRHGQETCKRAEPRCESCSLAASCGYAIARRQASERRSRGPTSRSRPSGP